MVVFIATLKSKDQFNITKNIKKRASNSLFTRSKLIKRL